MQEPRKQNTKTALLRAAERLFAEKGLGGVTSKDILRAAGARNETAIQYHFGDVQTLIKEVFYDRFKEIAPTRQQRLVAAGFEGEVLLTRLRLGFSISLIQVADFARRVEQGHAPPLEDAIGEATAALCGYLRAKPMA